MVVCSLCVRARVACRVSYSTPWRRQRQRQRRRHPRRAFSLSEPKERFHKLFVGVHNQCSNTLHSKCWTATSSCSVVKRFLRQAGMRATKLSTIAWISGSDGRGCDTEPTS